MARFKPYSYAQKVMLPISFKNQILPGTFEYALDYIVDNELDVSVFEERYKNDETGAPAYDPAILLKIVLYAYSRGITHSRDIESCCRENVVFMALSADSRPHFTTIAGFISSMQEEIVPLFRDILLYCDRLNLIDKTMFAIDGCKIPSNASKEWSGTRADFEKKVKKTEKAVRYLLQKHRNADEDDHEGGSREQESGHIEKMQKKIGKMKKWLNEHEDRRGSKGSVIKSNITDPESAKMPSSHGVIQGYSAVAVTDSKCQVVIHAETFGEGQEHGLLEPVLRGAGKNLKGLKREKKACSETKWLSDSGFYSKANLELVDREGLDAYIPDNRFRNRDPRFADARRHRKPVDRKKKLPGKQWFTADDFTLDENTGKLVCPAGNELYVKNRNWTFRGFKAIAYKAKKTDCRGCEQRKKCLRNEKTGTRQVHKFYESPKERVDGLVAKMKDKIDSVFGRYIYSRRMGIVEPVFANIRWNLGLDRFTLRSKIKTDIQWKLFAMVHNMRKAYRYGPGFA